MSSLDSICHLIVSTQTREALPWLLDVFLEDPSPDQRISVLDALRQIGDTHTAGTLIEACFDGNRLKPDVATEVLLCIGALRHPEAEQLLFGLLRNFQYRSDPSDDPADNYYFQLNTCLGLLHYDCKPFLPELEDKIRVCLDQNLFNEFIPALICKLPEPAELLEALYLSGRNVASVDCNAGIILGFGLSGKQGRPWLERIIEDENPFNWEVVDCGTGTLGWFCLSSRYAGISLAQLYKDLLVRAERLPANVICEQLKILKALLKNSFEEDLTLNVPFPQPENRLNLYRTLFTETVSLHILAGSYDLNDHDPDWTHTLENSLLAELSDI